MDVLEHLRSAGMLGAQAAKEGRQADSLSIYRNSAKSVIAAAPKSPASRKLRAALQAADQLVDQESGTRVLQQAFDGMLSGGRPAADCCQQQADFCPRWQQQLQQQHEQQRKRQQKQQRQLAWQEQEQQRQVERTVPQSVSFGHLPQSRRSSTQAAARPRSTGRVVSRPATPPLATGLEEHMFMNGSTPMVRAMSSPYLQATPHSSEPYFSDSFADDGSKTSHYTKMGAPKTNSHFKNTLSGANAKFHEADEWTTSNGAFFGDSASYKLPSRRVRKNPNFQYVNGDPRLGLSIGEQSASLPAYFRSRPEINGLR